MKRILLFLVHLIFPIRNFNNKCVRRFAENVQNSKILELGSGKKLDGTDHYSAKRYFDESNDFTQSDIVESYGHKVVDVTKMEFTEAYDVILCMNVLEHVYETKAAITNLHRALKTGGTLIIFVPMIYPLHDEPSDFWRFTEHALRKLFADFSIHNLKHSGIRKFPTAYFLELKK